MIRIKVSYNCNVLLVQKLYLHSDISFCNLVKLLLVQSFYSWTRNKLQEKVSQLFSIKKKVLYNISPKDSRKGETLKLMILIG